MPLKVLVICHNKWQNSIVYCRLGLVRQEVLSVHMPNLLYGLINDLLLITPTIELFREIFHSFIKSLIVRTDVPETERKNVCFAAVMGKRY